MNLHKWRWQTSESVLSSEDNMLLCAPVKPLWFTSWSQKFRDHQQQGAKKLAAFSVEDTGRTPLDSKDFILCVCVSKSKLQALLDKTCFQQGFSEVVTMCSWSPPPPRVQLSVSGSGLLWPKSWIRTWLVVHLLLLGDTLRTLPPLGRLSFSLWMTLLWVGTCGVRNSGIWLRNSAITGTIIHRKWFKGNFHRITRITEANSNWGKIMESNINRNNLVWTCFTLSARQRMPSRRWREFNPSVENFCAFWLLFHCNNRCVKLHRKTKPCLCHSPQHVHSFCTRNVNGSCTFLTLKFCFSMRGTLNNKQFPRKKVNFQATWSQWCPAQCYFRLTPLQVSRKFLRIKLTGRKPISALLLQKLLVLCNKKEKTAQTTVIVRHKYFTFVKENKNLVHLCKQTKQPCMAVSPIPDCQWIIIEEMPHTFQNQCVSLTRRRAFCRIAWLLFICEEMQCEIVVLHSLIGTHVLLLGSYTNISYN